MSAKQKKKFGKTYQPSLLIPEILLSLLLGFFTAIETGKLLLFPITTTTVLALFFFFQEDLLLSKEKKKNKASIRLYVSFYESFYHYTCLLNSYADGFKEAFDHLEISDLKDKLTDYQENHGPTLPMKLTNSFHENQLLDFMQYHLYRNDEPDARATLELSSDIEKYKEENFPAKKNDNPFFLVLLWAAVYLIGLYFALKG